MDFDRAQVRRRLQMAQRLRDPGSMTWLMGLEYGKALTDLS